MHTEKACWALGRDEPIAPCVVFYDEGGEDGNTVAEGDADDNVIGYDS